ncbi:MAG: hypothetical protein R2800_08385 [Flavipsychrobacter sp.]
MKNVYTFRAKIVENQMQIDIAGKVKEKKLAYSHTLLPVYEAIINSIHAIEDGCSESKGKIEIQLVRSKQQDIDYINEDTLPPIVDFIIRDNGVGFTEKNYESFNYAHSTYKVDRGGKGIGRITWLRAFTKAEIVSVYNESDILKHRKFTFAPTRTGIENHKCEDLSNNPKRYTEVRLKGLKQDYQKWCNKQIEDIAIRIIEHCFSYFLDKDKCPTVVIKDGDKQVVVNDYFNLYTKNAVQNNKLELNNNSFDIRIVKLYSPKVDNKIHYSANSREVFSEKISNLIPEIDSFILDNNNEPYSIAVYVSGNYLDDNVNEERTEIAFAKKESLFHNDVRLDELNNAVIDVVKKRFSDVIENLSEQRLEKVQKFVQSHPRFRHLLKYRNNAIKKLPSTLTDNKLEIELFKLQQDLEIEVLTQAKDAISEMNESDNYESLKERFNGLYNKIIEVGNSKLAEYVIHRKLVLELLDTNLKKQGDGKYVTEDIIHKLIFPLKKVSDDISFEDHNLWVIDERLAFHKYLASDIPMNKIEEIESKSKDRPDILIMNHPLAVTDNPHPYSSIILVEFKRPMRDDYSDKENPISQINKYCREIISEKGVDKDGRPLSIKKDTPIYAYIVCDITPKLREFADSAGYTLLPDNNGYFHYNPNYKLYTEIISFDKLIGDSKKRNQILFEKLSIE